MALEDSSLTIRSTRSKNREVVFTRPRLILAALAGLLLLAPSACGTDDASSSASERATDVPTVTIDDMAFTPDTLTVEAGDTVTWVWNDGGHRPQSRRRRLPERGHVRGDLQLPLRRARRL